MQLAYCQPTVGPHRCPFLFQDMYMLRVQEKESATRRKEREVSRMEKVEMQLIQKLKNTQQLQQRVSFYYFNSERQLLFYLFGARCRRFTNLRML